MANIPLSLTPALEAYLVALLYRNTSRSCLSVAALCAHGSHDALHRLLYSGVAWSRRLWDSFARPLVREGGYLVIDDTCWQRWALKSEAFSWVWWATAGRAVRERWPHRYGHARGRLRKVSHEVLVVKDGRRYFVTNDVVLTAREVERLYRHRQQIEETFRLLKQEFGWGGASAQAARAQAAHLHPMRSPRQ